MDNNLAIEKVASLADLSEVARLHSVVFSDIFVVSLGQPFMEFYFRKIFLSKSGAIFVCRDQGKIVGFVAGFGSREKMIDLKFLFYSLMIAFVHIFIRPKTILRIIRQIKRAMTSCGKDPDAELLSIAIEPEYRKFGMGRKLVDRFEVFLREQGVSVYEVYTDVQHYAAYLFYERLKFDLHRTITLFGLEARLYIKRLS